MINCKRVHLNCFSQSHSYWGSKGYFQVSEEEENKSSKEEEKPAQGIGCWSNRTNTRNVHQTLQSDAAHTTEDSKPTPGTENRHTISTNQSTEGQPDSTHQHGKTPPISKHIIWLTLQENDEEKDDDTDQRKKDYNADKTDSYN